MALRKPNVSAELVQITSLFTSLSAAS